MCSAGSPSPAAGGCLPLPEALRRSSRSVPVSKTQTLVTRIFFMYFKIELPFPPSFISLLKKRP